MSKGVQLTIIPGKTRIIKIPVRAIQEHPTSVLEVFHRIVDIASQHEGTYAFAQSAFEPQKGTPEPIFVITDDEHYHAVVQKIGMIRLPGGFNPITSIRPELVLEEEELNLHVSKVVGGDYPGREAGQKVHNVALVVTTAIDSNNVISALKKIPGVRSVEAHNSAEIAVSIQGVMVDNLKMTIEAVKVIDGIVKVAEAHLVTQAPSVAGRAYVVIKAQAGAKDAIIMSLWEIPHGLATVHPMVKGSPYDIVAVVEADSAEEAKRIVQYGIQPIIGIETLVVLNVTKETPMLGQAPAVRRVSCLRCQHETEQSLLAVCPRCKKGPFLICTACHTIAKHTCAPSDEGEES